MQILPAEHLKKNAVLCSNAYFSGLDAKWLGELANETQLRAYLRGEIILWQGDPCAGLFIIQTGTVKLFKLSPKGRELIIRVIDAGATFNEVPVFDCGLHAVNAAATEDCRIWVVPAEAIRRCLKANPEMAQAVILNLAHNLRTLVGVVEELSFYQVTSRLARLIARMPSDQLEGQRITQDQLAAHLGTVREVVARSLRDLERSGAIAVQRRSIRILDRDMLNAWGEEPGN